MGGEGSGGKRISVKGQDFFDAAFFHSEPTRPFFYRFIAELKEMCDGAQPTDTHRFLKELIDDRRVIRWYTQNIDGLEGRVGLATSISVATGTGDKNPPPVIGLHGTLDRLACTVCKTAFPYQQHELMKGGKSPDCPTCTGRIEARKRAGQRSIRGGILRPDIVLYNEPNPQGESIAEHIATDLNRRPTMLLVMGTSLKVVGLKRLIKDFARSIRAEEEGLVVFLNKTGIQSRSEWKSVFDYELVGESDEWIKLFRQDHQTRLQPQQQAQQKAKRPSADVTSTPTKPTKDQKATTPHIKQPAKKGNTRINAFFKHTKSVPQPTGKKVDKENCSDLNADSTSGPMTRSKTQQSVNQ